MKRWWCCDISTTAVSVCLELRLDTWKSDLERHVLVEMTRHILVHCRSSFSDCPLAAFYVDDAQTPPPSFKRAAAKGFRLIELISLVILVRLTATQQILTRSSTYHQSFYPASVHV